MLSQKLRAASKVVAEELGGWELSNAEFVSDTPIDFGSINLYISGLSTIEGMYLTDDGLQLYLVGGESASVLNKVAHASLETAFDFSTAYILSVTTFSEFVRADSIAVSPDGSRLYLTEQGEGIHEYSLSENYNPESATNVLYTQIAGAPTFGQFDSTGTKLYLANRAQGGVSQILQYSLSTAWDTATLSFVGSFDVTSELGAFCKDVKFNDSGTKMFGFAYSSTYGLPVYDLSTPWDISTAVLSENVNPTFYTNALAAVFNDDYTALIYLPDNSQDFYTFAMATAESFLNMDSEQLRVNSEQYSPEAGYITPDGTKLFVLGLQSYRLTEYALAVPFSVSSGSFVKHATTSSGHSSLYFTDDGLSLYIAKDNYPGGVYHYALSTPFDIDTISLVYQLNTYSTARYCADARFKSDGTKMYLLSVSFDAVYEYDLSTPWDISTATLNQSYSHGIANSYGFDISQDGLKMSIIDSTNDILFGYNLATAWDISTAQVYGSTSLFGSPFDVFYANSGANLYWIENGSDYVYQASQSTPYGIFFPGSANLGSISSGIGTLSSYAFNADGTKLIATDRASTKISKFNLLTAFDFSTLEWAGQSLMPSGSASGYDKIMFSDDGAKCYLHSFVDKSVYQYSLSTPYSVATATFDTVQYFGSYGDSFYIGNNGSTMYTTRQQINTVRRYNISTPWDISTNSFAGTASVSSLSSYLYDVLFSPDGQTLYIVDKLYSSNTSGWFVHQVPLATAWLPESFTASEAKSTALISIGISTANNLQFSDDGLSLHIVDSIESSITTLPLADAFDIHGFYLPITDKFSLLDFYIPPDESIYSSVYNNTIYEFTVKTPGDIRTISSSAVTTSISYAEVNGVRCYTFSPDGSKLFASADNGELAEYNTATPYSAVGITFVQKVNTSAYHTYNRDLRFSPSGHKMYFMTLLPRGINEWDLTTPWDISTAVFNQYYNTNNTQMEYFEIKPNGKSMYYGNRFYSVFQIDLGTAWDISTATVVYTFSYSDSDTAYGMRFNADGSRFVLGGADGKLIQFEIIDPV